LDTFEVQPFMNFIYDTEQPAWSPTGEHVAFVTYEEIGPYGGDPHIYIVTDRGTGFKKITGKEVEGGDRPAWSKDGKILLFINEGILYSYELETGEITVLYDGTGENIYVDSATWPPIIP
jgi:Tol biopolymer transport system component